MVGVNTEGWWWGQGYSREGGPYPIYQGRGRLAGVLADLPQVAPVDAQPEDEEHHRHDEQEHREAGRVHGEVEPGDGEGQRLEEDRRWDQQKPQDHVEHREDRLDLYPPPY